MLRVLCHTPPAGWAQVDDPDQISELRRLPDHLLWAVADVRELDEARLAMLCEEFQLHPLAVEDALHLRQRPKLESFDGHLLAVMHELDATAEQMEARQIACFFGERYLLVLHAGADRVVEEATGRITSAAAELSLGPAALLHAVADAAVDDYQSIVDSLEEAVDDIEEAVLRRPGAAIGHQLYALKRRLARVRRFALPLARVLEDLVEGSHPAGAQLIDQRTRPYFRDVDDHMRRLDEQVRHVESIGDAAVELQRAQQANVLNEVTKRLTAWAAIIAAPTFIASVYGMNFALVPRQGTLAGFWFAMGAMTAVSVALFAFFKRRDWI